MNDMTGKNPDHGDEQSRISAIDAMRGESGIKAMERLVVAMGDSSWRVRKTATDALQTFIGEEAFVPVLINSLRSADNAGLRNSAVEMLVKVGAKAVPALIGAASDDDEELRKFAVDILGDIGSEDSVDALITSLKDDDVNVRSSSAEALGKVGGLAAVDALLFALDIDDLWLRFAVMEALGKIGSGVPLNPLVKFLDNNFLKKPAIEALGGCNDPEAVGYLVKALSDEKEANRAAAVGSLLRLYEAFSDENKKEFSLKLSDSVNAELLTKLLASKSNTVKRGVIIFLGMLDKIDGASIIIPFAEDESLRDVIGESLLRMGERGGLDSLIGLLPDSSDVVRAYICSMLGEFGDPKAIPILVKSLTDHYGHVRHSAVVSLGRLDAVESIDVIVPLIGDEFVDVAGGAVEAIARIGSKHLGRVLPILAEGIKSEDSKVRKNIVSVLGAIGTEEVLTIVSGALRDESSDVRQATVVALGRLGSSESTEHLALTLTDEDSKVRLAAVHALSESKGDEREEFLMLATKDDDVWVRSSAFKGLGILKTKSAIDALANGLVSESGVVAVVIIDALYEALGDKAVEYIEKGLQHKDPNVVKAVRDKLFRIG